MARPQATPSAARVSPCRRTIAAQLAAGRAERRADAELPSPPQVERGHDPEQPGRREPERQAGEERGELRVDPIGLEAALDDGGHRTKVADRLIGVHAADRLCARRAASVAGSAAVRTAIAMRSCVRCASGQ